MFKRICNAFIILGTYVCLTVMYKKSMESYCVKFEIGIVN